MSNKSSFKKTLTKMTVGVEGHVTYRGDDQATIMSSSGQVFNLNKGESISLGINDSNSRAIWSKDNNVSSEDND